MGTDYTLVSIVIVIQVSLRSLCLLLLIIMRFLGDTFYCVVLAIFAFMGYVVNSSQDPAEQKILAELGFLEYFIGVLIDSDGHGAGDFEDLVYREMLSITDKIMKSLRTIGTGISRSSKLEIKNRLDQMKKRLSMIKNNEHMYDLRDSFKVILVTIV